MTRKRKVAAYARVSTDDEDQQTSYAAQCDYYERYIKSRSDWEFVKVYADEGLSGCNTKKRESFKAMVQDALNGKIQLIVTNIKLPYLIQSNFSISNGCIFKAIVGKVQQDFEFQISRPKSKIAQRWLRLF